MTERESQIHDWTRRLEGLGVDQTEIERHDAELAKQFGFEPPVNDVIWRVLNTVKSTDPFGSASKAAYMEMAQIVRGEGKSPLPYLQEAAKLELLEIKRSGLARFVKTQTGQR
jgi:hypothetical protein